MKKPIILLVDDESAVLEALEAALRPIFEEIGRVEAFADPLAALAATETWTAEDRAVAVAIVDQKMPALTGVEFLARLRVAPAARHARTILLTGYAGLDSAIAAKNDVYVDRYMEKPWATGAVVDGVRRLFTRYIEESGYSAHFVFREVVSPDDVRAHLELRYRIYASSAVVRQFLPDGNATIDADSFDAFSRLFGLFSWSVAGEELVGTLRVTGAESGPAADVVEEIASEWPELRARFRSPRPAPLPMMTYLADRDAVAALIAEAGARGEGIVEAGRLALSPTHRAVRGGGRGLARHILDSATAFFFFFLRIEHALIACVPGHAPLYRPLGFRQAAGTETRFYSMLGAEGVCLHGTCRGVPEPARTRVVEMAERIARRGFSCTCATFPECLGGPYASGHFVSTDLYCPFAAHELLLTN